MNTQPLLTVSAPEVVTFRPRTIEINLPTANHIAVFSDVLKAAPRMFTNLHTSAYTQHMQKYVAQHVDYPPLQEMPEWASCFSTEAVHNACKEAFETHTNPQQHRVKLTDRCSAITSTGSTGFSLQLRITTRAEAVAIFVMLTIGNPMPHAVTYSTDPTLLTRMTSRATVYATYNSFAAGIDYGILAIQLLGN